MLKGPRSSNIPVTTSTTCPRSWLLTPFSSKKNQAFLEKWLIPEVGQGKYKISLVHLGVPESKEMLKKQKNGGLLKEYRTQSEGTPRGQS